MKNRSYWWILPALIWLVACSPSFVTNADYDRSVNFKKFRTYQILDGSKVATPRDADPVLNSSLNRKRIVNAIHTQMAARQYEPANTNPDLLIKFYTQVKDRQSVQYNNNWSPWWGWGWGPTNTYVRTYKESTLIVDIVDARTNELIWQGWAAGEVTRSQRNPDIQIAEKVNELFKEYPVRIQGRSYQDPLAYH